MVSQEQFDPSAGRSALAVLRQATAAHHADIDSLLRLRQPIGLARYGLVLDGFAAYLAAWEPVLARALPARLQPWSASGRQLALLHRDLAALGRGIPAPALDDVPALPDLAAALGSLYVMEGSALGGQLISAQFRRQLGLTPERGAGWFHGRGAATAARWREFLQLLAAELDGDAAAIGRAVLAAQHTFGGLRATFLRFLDVRAAA